MLRRVLTAQKFFQMPQRLLLEPFVWKAEDSCEPFLVAAIGAAERLLNKPNAKMKPEVIGAVGVLSLPVPTSSIQKHLVFYGQERLLTLHLLLCAIQECLDNVSHDVESAERLAPLVLNDEIYSSNPGDRAKLAPSDNHSRSSFKAICAQGAKASKFFGSELLSWLKSQGSTHIETRGIAIETVAREVLAVDVFDADEDEARPDVIEQLLGQAP